MAAIQTPGTLCAIPCCMCLGPYIAQLSPPTPRPRAAADYAPGVEVLINCGLANAVELQPAAAACASALLSPSTACPAECQAVVRAANASGPCAAVLANLFAAAQPGVGLRGALEGACGAALPAASSSAGTTLLAINGLYAVLATLSGPTCSALADAANVALAAACREELAVSAAG